MYGNDREWTYSVDEPILERDSGEAERDKVYPLILLSISNDPMTLWIQPLFGDPLPIPFSPPMIHWRAVYQYLQSHHFPDSRIHQLRLFRGDSADLSGVEEGDMLRLFVAEPMVERWISEYSIPTPSCIYHYSTLTWLDARWGNPYQDLSIQYRTPLTLHIIAREQNKDMTFNVRHTMSIENSIPERGWYPTLREACMAFRVSLREEEGNEVCTENTVENVVHLWELYHGTNQHLVDQGRYYE